MSAAGWYPTPAMSTVSHILNCFDLIRENLQQVTQVSVIIPTLSIKATFRRDASGG